MFRSLFATLLMLAFSAAAVTASGEEGLYGPEFTFTYNGEVPKQIREKFIDHLYQHLAVNQPGPAKFQYSVLGEMEMFRSPNGWWFRVSDDPGVVEIQMKPMSVADTRRFKSDIQDAIFASAAAVGLYPWDYLGGGHLNVSERIFGGRLLLARNFVVDFWNHNELALGVLNYDVSNAASLSQYRFKDIAKVRAVLARADAGELGDGPDAIKTFFELLNEALTEGETMFHVGRAGRRHDLNFRKGRVEIRSVRPQANMDVWLSQIELIENRITNYLAPLTEPIPLQFRVPLRAPSEEFDPPVDPQVALRSFQKYVSESGLNWKSHRAYLWPPWLKQGEVEKFERNNKTLLACEGLITP